MTLTRYNATAATLTKNRTGGDWCPISGMCVTCVEGCIGMCEIGKSAYRGHEVIYPQPFGITTTASQKAYPVDLSHFNIMGTAVGAYGIEADSDKAIFPNVSLESSLGRDKGIKLRVPFVIPGLGSTNVAAQNWDGLAIGAAMSGVPLTIGENVCAMDVDSKRTKGCIQTSPDMERRVKLYKQWQSNGYGGIIVQANVEDFRLGVLEYAIQKLGATGVELKWGQGAKDIGGPDRGPSPALLPGPARPGPHRAPSPHRDERREPRCATPLSRGSGMQGPHHEPHPGSIRKHPAPRPDGRRIRLQML